MKLTKRRAGVIAAVAGVAALSVYGLMPKPVPVDVAKVDRGPLLVTVEEDAITRVRERFEITTPVAGKLDRVEVHPGDRVVAGQPLVKIETTPLDARQEAQLRARLESSRKAKEEADAVVSGARSALALARRESARWKALSDGGIASKQLFDQAQATERQAAESLDAATHRAQAAAFDVEATRAALMTGDGCCVGLRSPVSGRVLRVLQESESVVPAGARILDVGDPSTMEIVIDVLSEDAVNVRAGNRVLIEQWGGAKPLEARVRRVEPSGFTKISALGVEEQRVNVLADFLARPETIGDQFRVDARIVVWEGNVARIPATAIFGSSEGWSAFVLDGRRVRRRAVRIGHMGSETAEVTGGLRAGDTVVLHPSDQLRDGVAVRVGK